MVVELLLGDNPFIGISHLSLEKARREYRGLPVDWKIGVLEAALDSGATGFTFSTHISNLELLKYMEKEKPRLLRRLNYYILVPYAVKYVREATRLGMSSLLKHILFKAIKSWDMGLLKPPIHMNIARLFLKSELSEYLDILPGENIKAILLHEVLSDIVMAFKLTKLIEYLEKYFEKENMSLGIETRNILHLERFLDESKLNIEYVMIPLNPIGYQMPPPVEAEKAITRLSNRGVRVIAMNILASGACSIRESVEYLSRLKNEIYGVAVGTSKDWRAREIFKTLSEKLR